MKVTVNDVKVKFGTEKTPHVHNNIKPSLVFEPRTSRLCALLLKQTLKQKAGNEHPREKRLGRRLGYKPRPCVSMRFACPSALHTVAVGEHRFAA